MNAIPDFSLRALGLWVLLASACPPAPQGETCAAHLIVAVPEPSPLAEEGDLARVVIQQGERVVFDDEFVDLVGAAQTGGSVDVLANREGAPTVTAGQDFSVLLTIYSSQTNEVIATGRSHFDCDVNGSVDVPVYLGPANAFAPAAAPPGARAGATLTSLPDGRVLLFGGSNQDGAALPVGALFDPISGLWCSECLVADDLGRSEHSATALADGRVLITGGVLGDGALASDVLLFDPGAGAFGVVGTLARRGAGAARVGDDTVLVVGGFDDAGAASASAFIVGPAGVRAAIGSLAIGRAFPAVAPLPEGGALVAGGEDEAGPLDSLELFRNDETFGGPRFACPGTLFGENLCARRSRASAVVLDDGNILITGGVTVALEGRVVPEGEVYVQNDERMMAATGSTTPAPTRDQAAVVGLSCAAPPCPVLVTGGLNVAPALFLIAQTPPTLGAPDYGGTFIVGRDAGLVGRAGVAAVALTDGGALVVGGNNAAGQAQAQAARFTLCEASSDLVCPPP